MNRNLYQRKGFTIIEVVLVLAIAALIILMVFIAWPALQRTQRDQARKNDISLISTAVGSYKTNNKANLPSCTQLAKQLETINLSQYDTKSNPCTSGGDLRSASVGSGSAQYGDPKTDFSYLIYVPGARCDGEGDSTRAVKGSSRQAALLYAVEANGTPQRQCQEV